MSQGETQLCFSSLSPVEGDSEHTYGAAVQGGRVSAEAETGGYKTALCSACVQFPEAGQTGSHSLLLRSKFKAFAKMPIVSQGYAAKVITRSLLLLLHALLCGSR